MPGITTAGLDGALEVLDGTLYISVHDGAPGGGATNEAAVTRQTTTFAAPGDYSVGGRSRTNASEVLFEDVAAGTYEAWSVWTAATGGTCLWVVPFDVNRTLEAGDDLRGPVGAIEAYLVPE